MTTPSPHSRRICVFALSTISCFACTNPPGQQTVTQDSSKVTSSSKPNIVLVLVDDLSWNLVQFMPHVMEMQKNGMTFSRYYVSDSLCCPSRSSIFTGKFPHDTGVFTNSGSDGGYATFLSHGNEPHTFAVALTAAGYKTAFMGKYLNGYDPLTSGVPVGWSDWAGAGNGYPEYNYDLNQNGTIQHYGSAHDDYLTFVVSGLGQKFIMNTAQGTAPFMMEIATFAPHAPYIPGPDDLNLYPGLFVPRSPAYGARPKASAPEWEKDILPLTQTEMDTMDHDYRLRAQAVMAVDEMIANIQATLVAMGADKNTYIFFSSDNGYHMGEHSLRPGKMTAFDTDIRVPLIVTGPGVPAGVWVDNIVENIDLCPTFEELGGAVTAPSVDGHSLVQLLQGQTVSDWRTVALIEHHGPVELAEDPDMPEEHSGNPTKYESIRIPGAVYVEYATGETEYYDVDRDPWELTNIASTLSSSQLTTLHDTLNAVVNCHDGQACWAAQHLPK